MKNIVRFEIVKPQGRVTLDAFNPDFKVLEWSDILNIYLPYTRLFERITIKNFTYISEDLISRLTNQFLHGTEIEIVTPSKNFSKTYKLGHKAPDFYSYKWVPLDLSAPVPKSLAEWVFEYNGKQTTYLKAIQSLTTTRYLPNEIWNTLDDYSKSRIKTCREYNQGEYAYAEAWYKELMHDCIAHSMKMFSPNKKTYFEVISEITFDKACQEAQLQKGLRPLDIFELAFLRKYAPMYGVEIPMFRWKINSRKTDHGYTQEPEVCPAMSTYDWTKVIYDTRNDNNLPSFVRQGLSVRECENDKLLRQAYFQLQWIMKNLKDDGLMPGYKRCPKCHKIHREVDGCECGYCKPIEFFNADNMFYGDSSTFEDYENTREAYDDLLDSDFTLEIFEGLE